LRFTRIPRLKPLCCFAPNYKHRPCQGHLSL